MNPTDVKPPALEMIKRLTGWGNIKESRESSFGGPACTVFSLIPELKSAIKIEIVITPRYGWPYTVRLGKDLPVYLGDRHDLWRSALDGLKLVRALVTGKKCLLYMVGPDGKGGPNPYSSYLADADELPSPLQAGYEEDCKDPEGQWLGFDGKRYSLPCFKRDFFNQPAVIEILDPQRYRPYRYGWILSELFEQALALEEKLKMPLKDRLCGGRYHEERDDEDDNDGDDE